MNNSICVIGLGIGRLYVDVAKTLGYQVVTVDTNPNIQADYKSVSEIPEHITFTIAVICTPNATHKSIAEFISKHTKKILVEKPGFQTWDEWNEFQQNFAGQLFMAKNNMYRSIHNDIYRAINHYKDIESVNVFWLNTNRIPSAGNWFTNKSLSFGGVHRDLMPHAINVVQAITGYVALDDCNDIIAVKQQQFDLTDDVSSPYGTVNLNGIYDVDDAAYFHCTLPHGAIVNCCTAWKMNNISRDEIKWQIKLKNGLMLEFQAGLCPEEAYSEMLQSFINMPADSEEYEHCKQIDQAIHNIMNQFVDDDSCKEKILKVLNEG